MKLLLSLLCLSVVTPFILFAGDKPAQTDSRDFTMMEALTRQLLGQFDAIHAVISTPEYAAKTAKMYATHRDALVKEGFSREEAMTLLLSDGYFMKINGK